MGSLFDFPKQIDLLKQLFNSSMVDLVTPKLERLNEIFLVCEQAWKKNLRRLRKAEVKYILFSEAPPWTKSGPVRHFYNTFDGDLGGKVWRAFFDHSKPEDVEFGLQQLADRGVLVIDSLPFAMKYNSTIRKNPLYGALIKESSVFLVGKLNDGRIKWAKDVKAAFAFKLNGKRIMEAFPHGIRLATNRVLVFDNEGIAADRSGYTNSEKIKKIFGIRGSYLRRRMF